MPTLGDVQFQATKLSFFGLDYIKAYNFQVTMDSIKISYAESIVLGKNSSLVCRRVKMPDDFKILCVE